MPARLSNKAIELLRKPVIAHLATLMKDGSPQVTALWIDTDGQNIFINNEQERLKARNMKRDPRVALSITGHENDYYTLFIRGTVTGISAKEGMTHIDKLAKKYLGKDKYPGNRPGDVRVKVTIRPDKIAGSAAN